MWTPITANEHDCQGQYFDNQKNKTTLTIKATKLTGMLLLLFTHFSASLKYISKVYKNIIKEHAISFVKEYAFCIDIIKRNLDQVLSERGVTQKRNYIAIVFLTIQT